MAQSYAWIGTPRWVYRPRRITITAGVNDRITFRETSGVDLTATLSAGTYSVDELAVRVARALRSAGASAYTCTYSHGASRYTITSDGTGGGGIFELVYSGTAPDALPTLGFNATQAGALTYTSDTQVPGSVQLDFSRPLLQPTVARVTEVSELRVPSGRAQSVLLDEVREYAFLAQWETPAVALGWLDLVEGLHGYGGPVQLYPDPVQAPMDYVDVTLSDHDVELREMADQGLYRHYSWQIRVREWRPNTGTLDLRSLVDRRPM